MGRYERNILAKDFGSEQQAMLLATKVLVVGAGGLGSYVLQEIVASGIGEIGIVEFDTISISNLNRQTLYTTANIGESKAEVAKERLSQINPEVKITIYQTKFNTLNGEKIAHGYDMIVDCCDNYRTRYDMDIVCERLNIPLIHSSVSSLKGVATTFRYKGGVTYRDLYGEDNDSSGSIPGVLSPIVGLMGSIQAGEVIKIASKVGEPLYEKILTIDLLKNRFTTFDLK